MKKRKIMKIAILALFSAVLLTPGNVGAISSNPYNDWKTTAVNYPDNGQLVPAGPVTITWDRLDIDEGKVRGYEVLLDGVIQDTAIIDEGDTFSCEVYTTKVAQHQIKVLAQLDNDIKISTSVRNFYVSKKGIGFYSSNGYSAIQDAQNMGLSWYYNWGTAPTYTGECPNEKLDFVPMIWGAYNGSNEQLTTIKNAGYKTVLGYNEPDFADQSNVPVATAIANQRYFTDSKMRVGSPATAIQAPSSSWFNEYWRGINTDDIDFIPVHNYPGNVGTTDREIKDNAKSFLNFINETYNKFNKPIWVTEFAVANWDMYWDGYNGANETNKAEVKKFMNYVINGFDNNKGLDDLEFVERYAWFSFDALDRYGGDSGLFNTKVDHDKNNALKIGTLTSLGIDYRNFGNPEGYILPSLTGEGGQAVEDEYVDDYVNITINDQRENAILGSKLSKQDTPVKDGYVFGGWYSDEACTKEYDFDSIVVDNIIVYSKWLKIHTVKIDGIDTKVTDGKTILEPVLPVKDGYVFKGWYSDPDYINKFDFNTPIKNDMNLYSKWSKLIMVLLDDEKILIESGTTLSKPDTPKKEGYTFAGWYCNGKLFDYNQPVLNDLVIYAKWIENDQSIKNESSKYEDKKIAPVLGVKTDDTLKSKGYTFALLGSVAIILLLRKKYCK